MTTQGCSFNRQKREKSLLKSHPNQTWGKQQETVQRPIPSTGLVLGAAPWAPGAALAKCYRVRARAKTKGREGAAQGKLPLVRASSHQVWGDLVTAAVLVGSFGVLQTR